MPEKGRQVFRAVVIGVSTGGVRALQILLCGLPHDFPVPIIVVTHITPESDNALAMLLDSQCALRVKEADEHETALAGTAYLAPANYHLLIERDATFSLSSDPPVMYARPSADVLFESAAAAFGPGLIGVVLTGAGADGSRGLKKIKDRGGVAVVQDPADADMKDMPMNALKTTRADYTEPLTAIAGRLMKIVAGITTQDVAHA